MVAYFYLTFLLWLDYSSSRHPFSFFMAYFLLVFACIYIFYALAITSFIHDFFLYYSHTWLIMAFSLHDFFLLHMVLFASDIFGLFLLWTTGKKLSPPRYDASPRSALSACHYCAQTTLFVIFGGVRLLQVFQTSYGEAHIHRFQPSIFKFLQS